MLKILVCVKQVPDVNLVKMDPETGSLIRQGVPSILNPLDSCALEAAVQLKEQYGAEITCISMGPDMAIEALRECLAGGADNAVLLSDRAFANADTLATSYVIVTAAQNLDKYDLIFCGKETLDGATGQMASQLAERFNASQMSCVERIVSLNDKDRTIVAERRLEEGLQTMSSTLPCLISVEKDNFRPRIPNLETWKKSRIQNIDKYSFLQIKGLKPEKIGDPGSPTKVPRIFPPVTGPKGTIIDEGSTNANVEELLKCIKSQLKEEKK